MTDNDMVNLPVMDPETFPHGLRCMDCDAPISRGDRYTERAEGFVEGSLVTEIVCISCAEDSPQHGR